jgi:hypothetical protein
LTTTVQATAHPEDAVALLGYGVEMTNVRRGRAAHQKMNLIVELEGGRARSLAQTRLAAIRCLSAESPVWQGSLC